MSSTKVDGEYHGGRSLVHKSPPSSLRSEGEIISSLDIEVPGSPVGGHRPVNVSSFRRSEPDGHLAVPGTGGAFLTWEELWVTASDSSGHSRAILQDATGYAEPGRVLAIIGPSGCGKTTLLDSLAGRLESNTQQSGTIMVNGRKQTLSFGTSAYVTQDDVLMVTLTVKEAVYYAAQFQLPETMTKSEKMERADETIAEMGLESVKDTRIGGGFGLKGLSGGQKRRVNICIEILTHPKLLFLDEPTSGLDSAASYHIMNHLVGLSRHATMTVVASIHQPSSEVFQLFDNICLLSSGKTIFFGSTSMITKEIKQEHNNTSITVVEAIAMLTTSYKTSNYGIEVLSHISNINKVEGLKLTRGNQANFFTQCILLTQRSFINMNRDVGYHWFRFVMYLGLSITLGTIFYDLGHTYNSIQVFRRERLNGHYGVTAFVIGNTFSSAPYLALISTIPALTAYFLCGLQRGTDHIFFFLLVLYITMLLVESLLMIVASIVPNYLIGIIVAAGIQATMILCGGFYRLPNDLPSPFWKYPIYYLAFHKYANQAYYKNEFIGLSFPSSQDSGARIITGEKIITDFWQMEGYSKWVDFTILLAMVVIYRSLFLMIIKFNEKLTPIVWNAIIGRSKQPIQVMENPFATPNARMLHV